ncbi:hypothetical protein HPB50_002200 [Hyalomma asiaticum]|uniref:Uncharacterized protein n=1 Tax=Hyalomma asiaticum TaxID=266040 RepID=A0ACB7RP22_HYAAI|nr:hypothetical protein HPB50_002200 [Hyalomma asiaticum]
MTSFMKQHFKWYGRLCLVSGLQFVQLPGGTKAHSGKALWKQLYLLYSLFCFAQFVVIQVVLNFCCAVAKSRSVFDFFRSAAKYEITSGFAAPKRRGQATSSIVVRLLLCLVFIANVVVSSYLSFDFVDYLGYTGMVDVLIRAIFVGGNFLFYVFEIVHFVVLRPCAEVIRLYIRHQHEFLRDVLDASVNVPLAKRSKELEAIRINLCAIATLKQRLNAIWRWCIMVSGAVVLVVACICIYSAFVEEFSTAHHLLTILYTISSTLDFVDIANVSQQMVNEVSGCRFVLFKRFNVSGVFHTIPLKTTRYHATLWKCVLALTIEAYTKNDAKDRWGHSVTRDANTQ